MFDVLVNILVFFFVMLNLVQGYYFIHIQVYTRFTFREALKVSGKFLLFSSQPVKIFVETPILKL